MFTTYSRAQGVPCCRTSEPGSSDSAGDRDTARLSHMGFQEDGSRTEAERACKCGEEGAPLGLPGATLQESKILCEQVKIKSK